MKITNNLYKDKSFIGIASHFKSHDCSTMNSSLNNLVNCLKHLGKQNTNSDSRQYFAEKVLEAIYFFEVESKADLSQEDISVAAPLIKEVIKDLNRCVYILGNRFDQDRGSYNLILRSGVQFLLDDLKNWPADRDSLLESYLQIFLESHSLETFDKALYHWKEDPPVFSYQSITHTEEELKRPSEVPASHTWWF